MAMQRHSWGTSGLRDKRLMDKSAHASRTAASAASSTSVAAALELGISSDGSRKRHRRNLLPPLSLRPLPQLLMPCMHGASARYQVWPPSFCYIPVILRLMQLGDRGPLGTFSLLLPHLGKTDAHKITCGDIATTPASSTCHNLAVGLGISFGSVTS